MIRGSLTLRIFLITCLILLAACAVTYGLITLTTPITYRSIVTTEFQDWTYMLADQLQCVTFEDSGEILDAFIRETGGSVMITDEEDRIVVTPSKLAVGTAPTDLVELVRRQLACYDELIAQKNLRIALHLPQSAPFTGERSARRWTTSSPTRPSTRRRAHRSPS